MFLKGAEASLAQPDTSSIATRLTALIALSGFAVLLVGEWFLYQTISRSLDVEASRFLADKSFVLRAIIHDRSQDMVALDEETRLEGAARRFSRYYVRVLDDQRRMIIETPGMSELIGTEAFDALPPSESTSEGLHETRVQGRALALMVAAAPTSSGRLWHVQLVLDVSSKEAVLASYRRNLVLVLIAGLAVSTLAGYTIARRGLAPIEAITRYARDISITSLNRRMATRAWPKELSSLAEAFDQMLGRLEDSFGRLSQFSADIAHELRTPVTNFLTEAQVTLSQPRSPEEYRRVLESGIEEFTDLARLVDSLLFLARADQAQNQLDCAELDARAEIDNVIEFHRGHADENEVTLGSEGHARIMANSILFQRAISNLLSNAVRHTPRMGNVRVHIAETGNGSATIRVTDSGCGISAEHLPYVFDRFYRADASRTHTTGGFGLGLALVKSIVALHRGVAEITSEPGKGTQVSLTFPLAPTGKS